MGLITMLAAELAEPARSEAPFFVVGGALVAFAILVSVVGFNRPQFPGTVAAERGVIALALVLVVATMALVVYVAS